MNLIDTLPSVIHSFLFYLNAFGDYQRFRTVNKYLFHVSTFKASWNSSWDVLITGLDTDCKRLPLSQQLPFLSSIVLCHNANESPDNQQLMTNLWSCKYITALDLHDARFRFHGFQLICNTYQHQLKSLELSPHFALQYHEQKNFVTALGSLRVLNKLTIESCLGFLLFGADAESSLMTLSKTPMAQSLQVLLWKNMFQTRTSNPSDNLIDALINFQALEYCEFMDFNHYHFVFKATQRLKSMRKLEVHDLFLKYYEQKEPIDHINEIKLSINDKERLKTGLNYIAQCRNLTSLNCREQLFPRESQSLSFCFNLTNLTSLAIPFHNEVPGVLSAGLTNLTKLKTLILTQLCCCTKQLQRWAQICGESLTTLELKFIPEQMEMDELIFKQLYLFSKVNRLTISLPNNTLEYSLVNAIHSDLLPSHLTYLSITQLAINIYDVLLETLVASNQLDSLEEIHLVGMSVRTEANIALFKKLADFPQLVKLYCTSNERITDCSQQYNRSLRRREVELYCESLCRTVKNIRYSFVEP